MSERDEDELSETLGALVLPLETAVIS